MQLHYTLAFASIALAGPVLAQPTLDLTNNRPLDGQEFPVNTLDMWASEGPAGADAEYNFYSLIGTGNRTYTMLSASVTPSSASVPTANVLSTDGGSDTLFWNYAADGLYQVGAKNGFELLSNYTDPILELKYPCTFGTTWSDITTATYASPAGTATRTGTISGNADAHGSLGVSDNEQPNVLRVKVRRDFNDSSAPPLVITTRRITNTYYFFSESIPFPVVKLVVDSVSFNGGGFSVSRSAQWMGGPGGVGMGEINPDDVVFTPYPNPTSGLLDLRLGDAEVRSIEVFSATGQLVRTRSLRAKELAAGAVDLSGLPAGIYQVRVTQADGRRGTQRVVLQ